MSLKIGECDFGSIFQAVKTPSGIKIQLRPEIIAQHQGIASILRQICERVADTLGDQAEIDRIRAAINEIRSIERVSHEEVEKEKLYTVVQRMMQALVDKERRPGTNSPITRRYIGRESGVDAGIITKILQGKKIKIKTVRLIQLQETCRKILIQLKIFEAFISQQPPELAEILHEPKHTSTE